MEAELKAKYSDSKIELIRGGGGIFEVKVNGKLIYSKEKVHRFPNKGEITKLIEAID